MSEARGTISGPRDEHHVVFYGLSTCVWCKRARRFLESRGLEFDYVYVDLLPIHQREDAMEELRSRSGRSSVSFPTLIVDDRRCVVGYSPDDFAEALGL